MWLELCCLSIGFLGKAGQGRQGRGGAIYVREQQGCTELFWGTEDSLTEGYGSLSEERPLISIRKWMKSSLHNSRDSTDPKPSSYGLVT